jgi:hypothetical protein
MPFFVTTPKRFMGKSHPRFKCFLYLVSISGFRIDTNILSFFVVPQSYVLNKTHMILLAGYIFSWG